jgi:hypothetical protein
VLLEDAAPAADADLLPGIEALLGTVHILPAGGRAGRQAGRQG